MKKIDIKGKDYIPVNERIIYFRTEEDYKGWSYLTEIVSLDNGVVVMKTTVYDETGNARSNGFAYEKEGNSFINKTSYIENCETSSVGRALGNLGIGIDTSVASFEEVANAIKQQDNKDYEKNQEQKKMQQVTNDGKNKIMASLEKAENLPYKDTVIKSVCEITGFKNWEDLHFKGNLTYKKLVEVVGQELQKEKDLAQAGI